MRGFRGLVVVVLVAVLSACATPMKMGVTRETAKVDVTKESLLLMSVRLENAFKGSFHPAPGVLFVETPGASSKENRLNFIADREGGGADDTGTETQFRVMLPPGRYQLVAISAGVFRFPINGTAIVPLHTEIEVKPQTVTYLGRVVAKTRERGENEFRAGPPIPLLDQGVSGFSRTTWDIEFQDAATADLESMRKNFPALVGVEIRKEILPKWDRAKAQAWWEKN
jgi:hypothetical protein